MISVITQEYREGNLAVRAVVVTFLGIPIYKIKTTSTSSAAVEQLTPAKELTKVKGFIKHETKD